MFVKNKLTKYNSKFRIIQQHLKNEKPRESNIKQRFPGLEQRIPPPKQIFNKPEAKLPRKLNPVQFRLPEAFATEVQALGE